MHKEIDFYYLSENKDYLGLNKTQICVRNCTTTYVSGMRSISFLSYFLILLTTPLNISLCDFRHAHKYCCQTEASEMLV